MEQLVARRAHNPKVTGSSPVPATTKYSRLPGFVLVGGFFVFLAGFYVFSNEITINYLN
jgi:hypothetical protein